jgi:hypothetical protein
MKEVVIQLIAYFAANFIVGLNGYLEVPTSKENSAFKRGITFFIISAFLLQCNDFFLNSLFPAIFVVIFNYLIEDKTKRNLVPFLILQLLQIFVIFFLLHFSINRTISLNNYFHFIDFDNNKLILILSYILCLSPSNAIIRLVMNIYVPEQLPETNDSLAKAGRFIGSLERVLTLTLIYINQYEAIGFLIAAKSIIRTRDFMKYTEYLLIGTLLSFGTAIIVGLFSKHLMEISLL